MSDSLCKECPNRAKRCKTKAKLKKRSNILLVGGSLTRSMAVNSRHMSTQAMSLFSDTMAEIGLYDENFSYTNYVRCEYDPDTYDTNENKIIKKQCRGYLEAVINRDKPKVILPLGAEAASAVMGRAVKITKARGVPVWSFEFECWVMPTINPHMVYMNPQHGPIFASDCKSLQRLIESDYDPEEAGKAMLGDYSMVTDLQFLIDEDPAELSYDVETLGLKFAAPDTDLLTIQLCPELGRGYLIPWNHPESPIGKRQQHLLRRQLETLLTKPDRIYYGQNLKYDVLWLWEALGFRGRIDHDAKMLATLLDENLMNKDLDTLTKLYYKPLAGYADSFNAKYDKSRMDLVPLKDIISYGVSDCVASLGVCKALLQELQKDEKLLAHYITVSIPGLNTFAAIERRGQDIDEQALDQFEEVLSEEVARQYQSLIEQVPHSIQREHAEKGLKFTRAAFLLDILFYHEDGFKLTPTVFTKTTEKLARDKQVPSVSSKTHLPFFFEECPFTIELAEHIKTARLLGTSVRRFRENFIIDGKVYPGYALDGTATGRSSSRDPNGQNYPKHGDAAKAYRKIFVPPPHRIQIEADYSQAELRIAADMANDRTMLEIYNNDGDIHLTTAAVAKQTTVDRFLTLAKDEIKEARRQAKAVNFGLIYGIWWKSLITYAKVSYGVDFTESEAKRIHKDFFSLYSSLSPWHEKMKSTAMNTGQVRSYTGRIRHLPMVWSDDQGVQAEALRQSINSSVQETASSLGVMAMTRLEQNVDPKYLTISGFVHDAIYASVEPRHLIWGARTLKWYMETNPIKRWFDIDLKVKIVADAGFGKNGGEVHEMEGLTLEGDYDLSQHDTDFCIPEQETPTNNGRYTPEPHLINYKFRD